MRLNRNEGPYSVGRVARKRILLVDDDGLVLRIYRDGLMRLGFEVETADGGMAGLKAMRTVQPDLVVLDLMMPGLSGVDVLRLLRAQPDLACVPVVVMSNAYMDHLTRDAATFQVHKALLKSSCTPALLRDTILEALGGAPAPDTDSSRLLPIPPVEPPPTAAKPPSTLATAPVGAPSQPAPPPAQQRAEDAAFRARARDDLLNHAPATCATLRQLFQDYVTVAPSGRAMRLQNLYRKAHFLATTAGMADLPQVVQVTSALEALLFEAMDRDTHQTASVWHTIDLVIDFLGELLERCRGGLSAAAARGRVLVVDDDAVCNRAVVAALQRAQLDAHAVEKPSAALELLGKRRFDLALLDVRMPEMDGFELRRTIRALPGTAGIPIIFVTSLSEFEIHAREEEAGGDDIIAKPIVPTELAVKALMHVLRHQMRAAPSA